MACSDAELRDCLRAVAVFDHPQRSQRGRAITHAHYFVLPSNEVSPRVEAADDAHAAKWAPLAQISSMTRELFEDHYQIIDHFLKLSLD